MLLGPARTGGRFGQLQPVSPGPLRTIIIAWFAVFSILQISPDQRSHLLTFSCFLLVFLRRIHVNIWISIPFLTGFPCNASVELSKRSSVAETIFDLGGLRVRVFVVRASVFISDELDCAFLAATALFEVLDVVP